MGGIGMIKYLTKEQITAINHNQVKVFGGNFIPPDNFLHEENLDYLIEAVKAEMFGEALYPEMYQKAGVYMFNIICNHIFQDGNKRTGLQTSIIFLLLNKVEIKADNDALINFTISVASGEQTLEQVQEWFKNHI
ncbi:MAG: type II toxin-antitoxin system death-on-curing family toxin [Cytophagales bacterium]|nr:MAG: type II toxin-antitoxin system death-on-curing family toxin [Cytophagales bacterium]TAH30545.1 MAG: type II toxin-antitoxin system death-on-curing family toxin [Cytophagales bacterium]